MPADATTAPTVRRLLTVTDGELQQLAELLVDCVDGGVLRLFDAHVDGKPIAGTQFAARLRHQPILLT